jgi:hypothetical protein
VLVSMQISSGDVGVKPPPWATWLAHHRDDFAASIFRYEHTNGEAVHYKFTYAMQNPVFFAMQVIVPCIDDDTPCASDEDGDMVFEWSHRFKLCFDKMVCSDSLCFDDRNASVYVLMDAVHRRGGLLLAAGRWVPLERLLMSMPWPGGEGAQLERPVEPHTSLDDLPAWVSEELLWDRNEWDSVWSRSQSKGPSVNPEKVEMMGDDISQRTSAGTFECDDDELYDELVFKRAEVDRGALKVSNFRIIVRGGRFAKTTFGVACDTFRAEAMPGLGVVFCVALSITLSASFSIRMYGETDCTVLANGWLWCLQQLFDIWQREGSSVSFRFQAAHLLEISETDEFRALASRAVGAHKVRVEHIRAIPRP